MRRNRDRLTERRNWCNIGSYTALHEQSNHLVSSILWTRMSIQRCLSNHLTIKFMNASFLVKLFTFVLSFAFVNTCILLVLHLVSKRNIMIVTSLNEVLSITNVFIISFKWNRNLTRKNMGFYMYLNSLHF